MWCLVVGYKFIYTWEEFMPVFNIGVAILNNKHGKNLRSCNWQVAGEICIVWDLIICICQQILLWLSLYGKWDRWEMQHTYGIWEIPTEVLLREGTTGRLIINGMVILKLPFKEESLGVWTVLSLLMTEIGEQNSEPSDCLKGEEFDEWVGSF